MVVRGFRGRHTLWAVHFCSRCHVEYHRMIVAQPIGEPIRAIKNNLCRISDTADFVVNLRLIRLDLG
jgi:hypothetical protein